MQSSNKTLAYWRERKLIRWLMTQWCNYKCSYCPQEHGRKQIFRGAPGHWADNHDVDAWMAHFEEHFLHYDCNFILTGGEPMMDKVNMEPLLRALSWRDWVQSIKIDTNCSWNPVGWDVDKSKVVFLCSFHPEHTDEDSFFNKLQLMQGAGWRIGIVNLVVLPDRFEMLARMRDRSANYGLAFSAVPLDGQLSLYTSEQVRQLQQHIPAIDWEIRTGGNPIGRNCLHPAVTYKVYPSGELEVGCHEDMRGSILDDVLPSLPYGYTPCPKTSCMCTEKYTFLEDMDINDAPQPMTRYAERISLL